MKKWLPPLICGLLTTSFLVPAFPLASSATPTAMERLLNLQGIGGCTWHISDQTISCAGTGDMFALSDTTAVDFVYETEVEFTTSNGAASLVFFAGNDPAHGSYVANIDLGAGNARIFRFEQSGSATTKGEYKLTSGERSKKTFHLRVESYKGELIYFLDHKPIIHITDQSAKAGYRLGLLTFNTEIRYTNLGYATPDSDVTLNTLTGIDSTFSGKLLSKATIPHGTTELTLTAKANGTLSATAFGATAEVNGKTISVSNISNSFDLVIGVQKGSVYRSYLIQVKVEADPATLYNEEYRPQYHFSPLQNWLNDPNGLVYDSSDSSWHLFFQYNPYGLNIANQVWGHAVSTDLVHWKELDIAIPQDHLGAVFSGSAVVDENNTSGFFTDNQKGESKLVALYTSDGGDTTHGVEKQCIAYSKDHGVTWIKPTLSIDANIVISNQGNRYGRDFRDPKIFRYDDKWFMVIAGGRARLFTSDNLIDWTMVCDMGFDSECPDFYPLPVDGDENNIKWVYTASGKWYVVGRLEKISDTEYKFIEEGERIPYNGGSEVYATQSFYNDGTGQNRRIAISWIQDHSASSLKGKTWNGSMTLPYEQTLRTVNGKIILTSYPVAEVDTLIGDIIFTGENPNLLTADYSMENSPGKAYDLRIVFTPEQDSVTTLILRDNGTNRVEVVYDYNAKALRVIRGRASAATGSIPASTMEMPLYPDQNGNITLRILMDTTIIEVFGNEGEAALCGMIFPDKSAINSSLTVKGNIAIQQMQMWKMESAWHKGEAILPESGIYLDVSAMPDQDNKKSIHAYYLDDAGTRVESGVTITQIQSTAAKVAYQQNYYATIDVLDNGKVTVTATYGEVEKIFTFSVAKVGFETTMDGWTSKGDWYEGEGGYGLAGSNGDSFAFSQLINQGDFTYSGVANFGGQGGCLGLVFGVSHPDNPSRGTWYGANVDTHGEQVVIKLFCNANGIETWKQTATIPSAELYRLSVNYHNGLLTFTVNERKVQQKLAQLPEGRLGLVSWNGGGSFNEVVYTAEAEPPNPPIDSPAPPIDAPDTPDTPSTPPVTAPSDHPPASEQSPNTPWLIPVLLTVGLLTVAGIGFGIGYGVMKKRKKQA